MKEIQVMVTKTVASVEHSPPPHWVGDGFFVRPLFAGKAFTPAISPFLMLDYAAPVEFPPRPNPPGVDPHPHRGFETVTIVYSGEIEHRDSAGHEGRIGPGDVQWMTAASGVVHDEFHSRDHSARGGLVSMVQLWVNLPASHKMDRPRYQPLLAKDIPTLSLPGGAGTIRIISGRYGDTRGPAETFTPVSVWDLRLKSGGKAAIDIPAGHRSMAPVLEGEVSIGNRQIKAGDVAFLGDEGQAVEIEASADSKLLILSGEPINEPIAHYGPFVMNTQAELRQAVEDFRSGRMGELAA